MSKDRYRQPLVDLYTPWTPQERGVIEKAAALGMGSLEPKATVRQPYDSLYLKQKASRDYWS